MGKRDIYALSVRETVSLSPHFRRIVLGGDALRTFPEHFEGGYIKLLLRKPGAQEEPVELRDFCKRSFTVRSFDRESLALTLDFALHETDGPGMKWAMSASVGDEISIVGPGPVQMLNQNAEWFFLAGDATALSAIAVNLESLPADAKGHAIIEVPSEADRLELIKPDGVALQWVVTESPRDSRLAEAAGKISFPSVHVSAWAACEFSSMKALRTLLRDERQVPKESLYISSYWKLDSSDEQHKAAKKAED